MVAHHLPPDPPYSHFVPYLSGTIIEAGGEYTLEPVNPLIQFTQDQRTALDARTEFLWIFGFIKFQDFFGKTHRVRFCEKWNASPNAPGGPVGLVFDSDTPKGYIGYQQEQDGNDET
jgi:hypothetical protein